MKNTSPTKGFTLSEMLVVIAITSLVGLSLWSMIATFYKSNAYLLQQTTAVDSAHRGLNQSFRALRQASYGDDGSYPIASAGTSTITFFSDADKDGSIEKVRLYLSNGTLYKGVTNSSGSPSSYTGQPEATTTIAAAVQNDAATPLFRYFDADGVELTTPINIASIATILTSVRVDLNPNRAPDIMVLQETATLRNLRTY